MFYVSCYTGGGGYFIWGDRLLVGSVVVHRADWHCSKQIMYASCEGIGRNKSCKVYNNLYEGGIV